MLTLNYLCQRGYGISLFRELNYYPKAIVRAQDHTANVQYIKYIIISTLETFYLSEFDFTKGILHVTDIGANSSKRLQQASSCFFDLLKTFCFVTLKADGELSVNSISQCGRVSTYLILLLPEHSL